MKDLNVLITGAAGGFGSALAMRMSELGANLLLLDQASRSLDTLADRIYSSGLPEPGVCPLDLAVAGVSEYEELAAIMETEYGGLDILVHCAASFPGLQPITQISGEQWSECMQVNLNAPWLLTMVCMPLLRQSNLGAVVFVQECANHTESAYWGAYGVSKSALFSLGRIMAEEFDGGPVRIMNFHPGPMRTELRARAYLAEDPASVTEPAIVADRLINELTT